MHPSTIRTRRRTPQGARWASLRALAAAALGAASLLLAPARPLDAQSAAAARPRYRFEAGAALGLYRFGGETRLQTAPGGVARLGVWLPLGFSIEGEGAIAQPQTDDPFNLSWSVRTLSAALLFNVPLGPSNFLYLKGGYGGASYDGELTDGTPACGAVAAPGGGPCGDTGMLQGGLGLRFGVAPWLSIRSEALAMRSSRKRLDGTSTAIVNYTANIGVSAMLGTRVPGDADRDGIVDGADRCPGTRPGAAVDARGCPADTDRDGVANYLDRCADTPAGQRVEPDGCPRDTDQDGVADASDRCADTPQGASADERGCTSDSDGDEVLDGLDRCADTPQGATVDAVGCPGDEDSDGVLDGLDRCPRTPAGSAVNPFGCLPNQTPGRPGREPADADAPAAAPDTAQPRPSAGAPSTILRGVNFATGSARLERASYAVLDSVAAALKAEPSLVIEIGGHTDASGSARTNQHISQLRAEAVRAYLVRQGVAGSRMTARGYGASDPIDRANTAAARARNRRVEIRPIDGAR